MRRVIAAALAALLALGQAFAEESDPMQPELTPEEAAAFVEMMFGAAAGTDQAAETDLRAEMTGEQIDERNAQQADYRAKTIRWLMAALTPETSDEQPEPLPSASPTPETGEEPIYTAQDGYDAFAGNEQGRAYLARLSELGGGGYEADLRLSRSICEQWMDEIDHRKLAEMNGDYRCWIYAPGTQIDYPVVQCEDNSYYLKRMFNRERNSAGTLFIDYRNLSGFQDPNTLIYGHHMRNDSMFGSLTDYAEQTYFESRPFMLVMSGEERFLLEVFAGYTTTAQDHCYDIAISDEEDMRRFVEEAEAKSDFTSGTIVQPNDRLATLSTCAYAFENARYILIGRIVPVWHAEAGE